MKKNIIFDWSGVVRNTVTSQLWIVNKIFERYGVGKIGLEEFRDNWRQPYIEFYSKYLPKGFDMDERAKIYKEALFDKNCPKSKAFTEVVGVIKNFKERKFFLAVASSDLKESLIPEVNEWGLDGVFDEIITDIDDKLESVKKLIQNNNLDKENTFFVGDSNHEIDVSKETGINSVAVTWGFTSKERLMDSKPDYVVDSAKELLDVFV